MSTVIWRFSDGKAGHDGQSRGLAAALQRSAEVSVFDIDVRKKLDGLWHWLTGRYPPGGDLPVPDLLIGAGHTTHWHMLAARRCRGGRIVVLMKPSLPLSCFDLCLIPEHDGPVQAANVLRTQGVLNTVQRSFDHDRETGLIVLGGPSRHYCWHNEQLLSGLERLVRERPVRHWLLTSSRRTPDSLVQCLVERPEFDFVPYPEADSRWLSDKLAEAGEVWVSEDSISMIHEALTSGARVGLLQVERFKKNRLTRAVDALVEQGRIGAPGDWQPAADPGPPLNEATRCANWIKQQWLDH